MILPRPSPGLPWTDAELDRALWIPLSQPFGRLAFYLLDPRSDDGFVYWGCFHPALLRGDGMWGEAPRFPVLALGPSDLAPARAAAPERPERAE